VSKWERVKWSEAVEIRNGRNQKAVEDIDGQYPIYGSGGIMGYANDYLCDEGTVIIGRKGNINKPIYVNEKFWNVDTAFGLRTKKSRLISKYLYYFCVNFNFEKLNTTVTIPSLTKSNLLNIQISLPPLETQKQIAKTLDTVTELLAISKEQLAELDNLIKSTFFDMFGDPITNEKGWPVEKMGKICNKITDGKHGDCNDEEGSGYYFISAKDINNGMILYDNVRQITPTDFQDANKRTKVSAGDLVVVNTGATIGKTAIVRDNERTYRTTFQKSVAIIEVISSKVSNLFLQYYIILNRENIYKSASGSAQKNWLLSQMRNYPVILPPRNLQNHFTDIAIKIEEQKAIVQKAIGETQYLFDSLMNEYFE